MLGSLVLKFKQLFKSVLTGLIIIISLRKYLPVLWGISLFTAGLSCRSWPLAASVPEVLKKIDIVYYIYFPWYKKYNIHKMKNCRIFSPDSDYYDSSHSVLRCRESISLLRPVHMIKAWQREQSKIGFLTLTINKFGIKNVHGYIKEIKSAPSELFSTHGENLKAGVVTGRFVRHVADVRKYQFKNKTTGQISWLWSTPGHPFYVKNREGFISVEAISPEDEMLQKDGQIVKMNCSTPYGRYCGDHGRESMVSVYNLEIAQKHTYFVGRDFILVHNVCKKTPAVVKKSCHKSMKEHFLWFYDNGYIETIDDGHGGKTLSFKLNWEEGDSFNQRRGLSKAKTPSHRLRTNIYYPLKKLGFTRMDKLRGSTKGKVISWELKDKAMFRQQTGQDVSDFISTIPSASARVPTPTPAPALTPAPILISAPVPTPIPAVPASIPVPIPIFSPRFDFREASTFLFAVSSEHFYQ